ncbi:hypothetical protein ACWEU6_34655 [Streptosporangium sandarakinum]|uniref:hypothetical protein n=1 Tax=Streptosporangium sandarakinum TaxID=1260955 RepID=UPI0036C1C3D3
MVASNGYGYRHGTMARAAVDLDSIDEQLNDIRRILETECALPSGAFGWGAEMGRRSYEKYRNAWHDELGFAVKEGRRISELAAETDRGYLSAESPRVQELLYTVGWAPDASGRFKVQPSSPAGPPGDAGSGSDGSWLHRGLLGVGVLGLGVDSWALKRHPEWRRLTLQSRRARKASPYLRDKHPIVRAALVSGQPPVPPGHTWYIDRKGGMVVIQSQSAVLSRSTTDVLHFARRFSLMALTAGVVWELLAVPSDADLNRAALGWDEIGRRARQIFGGDLAAIRELAVGDWSGVARNAADERVFSFIRGGIDLADFASDMAARLSGLIEQLNALHKAAYWTASVTVAALTAHAALSFTPVGRLIARFLGSQLTTMVMFMINIAPALAASAFAGGLKDAFHERTFLAGRDPVRPRFGWL